MSLKNDDLMDRMPTTNDPKDWIKFRFTEEFVRFQEVTGFTTPEVAKMLGINYQAFRNYIYDTQRKYSIPSHILNKVATFEYPDNLLSKFPNKRPFDFVYIITGRKETLLERDYKEEIKLLKAELVVWRSGKKVE